MTLFAWPNHSCHFESQPSAHSHDETGFPNFKLANWAILLSQYDMAFVLKEAVKGQALTEFLAGYLGPETLKLYMDIPDEVIEANMTSEDEVWRMFFDGVSRTGPTCKIIARVGVVFVSPESQFFLVHSHRQNRTPMLCSLASNLLNKWGVP